ncbi:MAG TPA: AraC family transcriptional regulator [Acetobacteraceae bacterium]|nr:AraC family transcriptional regulator [Acetobacteraceae bacterium]
MDSAGTIRVAPVLPLMQVVRTLGRDPAAILAEAGWSPAFLEDPDGIVPYTALGRLVAIAAARTGCEHIGLLVGQRGGAQSLGMLGFAVRHAPDVRSALRLLVRHFAQHDRGAVVTLQEDGPVAALSYRICIPSVPGSEQIIDGAITIGFRMMKALCGPQWRPLETSLARRRPPDPRPYHAQFGEAVRFDAEDSALYFSARWLDEKVRDADPELERLLLRMILNADSTATRTLRDEVRQVLAGTLGRGAANQEAVARAFGISTRTLHRRLAALGTSFQDVLAEVRCDIACRLLADTGLPIGQVALLLDYREPSAFTRSFNRRLGHSPAAWRASRR